MKLLNFLLAFALAALFWAVLIYVTAWVLGYSVPFFGAWLLGVVILVSVNSFTGNIGRAWRKFSLQWDFETRT